MTVTLTSPPAKANTVEPAAPKALKPPPPEAIKPKVIPKPKPVIPKPEVKKIEDTTHLKATDSSPREAVEQPKPLSPPSAPSPTTSQTPSPSVEPLAGHFEGPKLNADYLHNPRPDYPIQAKRMGWEGRVVLRVDVLADGSPGAVTLAKSSGHELLDEAALEAVRRWKFVPAKRDGSPVSSSVNVPINFNLKNE